MALPHAHSGQLIDIGAFGDEFATARTTALFKTNEIEVMRLVLPAGKSMPAHKVPGEITVQCLEGKIEFAYDGGSTLLSAGQMLYLAGGVEHSLLGLEDASVLVTVVLRK